jgi:hypothetical protein
MIRLVCAALFVLGWLVPASAAPPDDALLAHIGSAQTVRVVVDQQYHHTGHIDAATGPKTMPDYRLPFLDVAAVLLRVAGVRVVGPDATQYDATLTISARGRAIGNFYFDGPEGYLFTGAELSGEIVFTAPGLLAWRTQFAGRHLPPANLSINLGYENPANAPLLKIFNTPTSYVARMMTVIATAYGAAPLIAVMDRDTPTARVFAARALGDLRDSAATDALIVLLTDQDPALRREAAWSLGRIGDRRATPALTAALDDFDIDVRWYAKWALEKIDPKAM